MAWWVISSEVILIVIVKSILAFILHSQQGQDDNVPATPEKLNIIHHRPLWQEKPRILYNEQPKNCQPGCSVCGGDVFHQGNYPVFGQLRSSDVLAVMLGQIPSAHWLELQADHSLVIEYFSSSLCYCQHGCGYLADLLIAVFTLFHLENWK